MTVSQSSNVVHLPKEAALRIAALRHKAERCRQLGYKDLAWDYSARAMAVVNSSTLDTLTSGDFSSDDLLMFGEVVESYEEAQVNQNRTTIHLKLSLLEGSPLTAEIIEVLKKHMNEGEISHE
jgi:hypothetical protein